MTEPLELYYLNALDVARLALGDDEILAAVDAGLRAQGHGETVIEPRVHLTPDAAFNGHFNVLRGYVAPLGLAGVKVVSDYVDNYRRGLPSEMGLLNLFDPRTGRPLAIIDAAGLTDMRTGAVTAIGARHLARRTSRILGHIGARGTAYWNVRLLDRLFDFDEIRVHSRRPESREGFARRLSRRARQAGRRDRRLGNLRARRRHRRRGLAPRRACAVSHDRLDQAGRARRALRHDERRGIVPDRHHGQDRGRRLGPVPERTVRQPARACRHRQADGGDAPRRARARSSSAARRVASATTKPSCSGIAGCRCRTSPSATRCSPRRAAWASASVCATREPARMFANARMYSINAPAAQAWRALLQWVDRSRGRGVRDHRLSAADAVAGVVDATRHGLRVHVRLPVRAVQRRSRSSSRRRFRRPRRTEARLSTGPISWCAPRRRTGTSRTSSARVSRTPPRTRNRAIRRRARCWHRTPGSAAGAVRRRHRPARSPRAGDRRGAGRHRRRGSARQLRARAPARARARARRAPSHHRLDAADTRFRRWWRRPASRRRWRSDCVRRCSPPADAPELAPVLAALLRSRVRRDRRIARYDELRRRRRAPPTPRATPVSRDAASMRRD